MDKTVHTDFNADVLASQFESAKMSVENILDARYQAAKFIFETTSYAIPLDPDGSRPSQKVHITRALQNGEEISEQFFTQFSIRAYNARMHEIVKSGCIEICKKRTRRGCSWKAANFEQLPLSFGDENE